MTISQSLRDRLFDALLGKPLVSNAFRGALVEAMIAETLEPEWRWCADGWGEVDFRGPEDVGLEVKQSAARQSWHDGASRPCQPRFDIAARTGYWGADGRWMESPGRNAAIYIFGWHPIFDPETADHRNVTQWQFFVVNAHALPEQKTIGLKAIRNLAQPCGVYGLLDAVAEVAGALSKN